jgi:DNA-directed RNA polymerase subunit RPC12/RpoP
MKDIRIDGDGNMRCWNCGAKGLTAKRTLRSKALVGVGSLLTKKKLKCQRCGQYNDTGSGQPYNGPEGRKYRQEYEAELAGAPAPSAPATEASIADQLTDVVDLHKSGALTDAEFETAKAEILGESPQ